jgi:4-hydroxybenzoate polyprenyltransferase
VLLRCTHPGPSLAVTAIATALALAVGRGWSGAVVVAVSVGLGQLCIGATNDLLDADRDRRAGRTDKPLAAGLVSPDAVRGLAVTAGVLGTVSSLVAGLAAAAATAVVLAGGLCYDAGIKRTWWSWFPFAVAFGMLPAVATLGLPGAPWPTPWAVAVGALLGVAAHFTNALPDLDADRESGVVGLPHRLGPRVTAATAWALLVAAALVLVLAPPGPPTVAGWVGLSWTAVAGRWLLRPGPAGSRAAFAVAALSAVVLVVLFLGQADAMVAVTG